ncbi:MAG: ABC transporter ATP-binding protein [Vicinamibacteria bacterium]|nr:ABC transporter ATP-binding protein [Vicinamibacteria bacterium]
MKTYDGVQALRGISIDIARGGIVGLLGPNGAGKTTFVEILEGLRPGTSGSVRVLGLDPDKNPVELRRRIGVQLQHTEFPEALTVEETFRLFGAFYPTTLGVPQVLEAVSLTDKKKAAVRSLSGGQKQRLAIGLATLHDPELLILDEPTSGLDPIARRGIHEILLKLKALGKTILLSSHYLDEIEALADRVVILRSGDIVADGTPMDLLAKAEGASTLWIAIDKTIDPANLVPGATFEGYDGVLLRYATKDSTAAIVGLGASLKSSGASLLDLRLKRPTLEDLYIQLIGGPAAVQDTPEAARLGSHLGGVAHRRSRIPGETARVCGRWQTARASRVLRGPLHHRSGRPSGRTLRLPARPRRTTHPAGADAR